VGLRSSVWLLALGALACGPQVGVVSDDGGTGSAGTPTDGSSSTFGGDSTGGDSDASSATADAPLQPVVEFVVSVDGVDGQLRQELVRFVDGIVEAPLPLHEEDSASWESPLQVSGRRVVLRRDTPVDAFRVASLDAPGSTVPLDVAPVPQSEPEADATSRTQGLRVGDDQFLFGAQGVLYRVDLAAGALGTPQPVADGLEAGDIRWVTPGPDGEYVLVRQPSELVYAPLSPPNPKMAVSIPHPDGVTFREPLPTSDGRGAFVRHDPGGLHYFALEDGPGPWVPVDPEANLYPAPVTRPHPSAPGVVYETGVDIVYVGVGPNGPLPPQPLESRDLGTESTWSPDGRWLAVVVERLSNDPVDLLELLLFRFDDGHDPTLEAIFEGAGHPRNLIPTFTPDSRFVYINHDQLLIERLFLEGDAVEEPQLVLDAASLGGESQYVTEFSPDGSTLLVTFNLIDGPLRPGIVHVTDTNVGALELLGPPPPDGLHGTHPSFSPHRNHVRYFEDGFDEEPRRLMLVAADDPTQAFLLHPGVRDARFVQ